MPKFNYTVTFVGVECDKHYCGPSSAIKSDLLAEKFAKNVRNRIHFLKYLKVSII